MGHSYSDLLVHVVFSTKDRQPSIRESFRERLYEYMAGLARQEFGVAMKIGGTENHVHALVSFNRDVSVAEAMCKWKSLSSGWIHRTFPEATEFAWQAGYGAFSVSHSNADRVHYIAGQLAHHKSRSRRSSWPF